MSTQPPPARLIPSLIRPHSPEYVAVAGWPHTDSFVDRMLRDDIPQRVQLQGCCIWAYRNEGGELVGFGSLVVCDDCREFSAGRPHTYIPLLVCHPEYRRRGYGEAVLRHLVGEAARIVAGWRGYCDTLFLDVYSTSTPAIALYGKCGFVNMTADPIADDDEPGKSYFVMAKRVSSE